MVSSLSSAKALYAQDAQGPAKGNGAWGTMIAFTGFSVESTGNPNPTYMNIMLEEHDDNQTLWIARNGLYKYDLPAGKPGWSFLYLEG